MEDYKKKYEEALERARKINNGDGVPMPHNYTVCESIFPELKKSEDERIRKAIKEAVEYYWSDDTQARTDIFAWLEKQGEQKLLNNDKYQTVPVKILDRLYESEKELELLKKGEQKPTDKVESKFKVKYAGSLYNVLDTKELLGVTFYGIEDEPNHIDYIKAESCEMISGFTIKKNGLPYPTKPAVFSKQNPTWSEEDEMMLKEALRMIEKPGSMFKGEILTQKVVNWLQLLKERYTWKPSDEQMDALKDAVRLYKSTHFDSQHYKIESLYEDLKKLKGE